jgi:hypothetical protein
MMFRQNRLRVATALFLGLTAPLCAEDVKLDFHGAGWNQFGRVEKSYSSTADLNYNKNWLGSNGGLVAATARIDENWEGGLGLGTVLIHLARGSKGAAENWYSFFIPFVDQARVTYTGTSFAEEGGWQVNLGYFPYSYNSDTKYLGMYLLRGYVYPGTLISGTMFQGAPVADFNKVIGGMLGFKAGGFKNELIFYSETENKPLFDYSLAYVVSYSPHPSFEIGAGVNFYRLIPNSKKATSPGKDCNPNQDLGPYAGLNAGQENGCYGLDTVSFAQDSLGNPVAVVDTVTGSLAGTKLMLRFRLDPKAWFGNPDALGKNDLVLYGEGAVIGLKDYKDQGYKDVYGDYYPDILRRIPVMMGFNLPGFKLLDLSVEIEYYANKNSNDNIAAQGGSWLPVEDPTIDNARDDWKWSVNASRMLFGNMVVQAQVANDHLRLGGSHNTAGGIEATRNPKEWYWTGKIAYFF